jgi:NAD(P)-dependent dehydrogenase (short-subunit alcohol dehydrogenase family)/biotin carboxylase
MNKTLIGKRLLILGGNPETIPLVKKANEMGVITIVTSLRSSDKAKEYAKLSFDVDGLDIDGLVNLALQQKIDGVLVGVADILVPSYYEVCNRLNLPCYVTDRITDVFSYKDKFKETCESYGIHGIPEYKLDSNLNPEDIDRIVFPVMVKPVDNGGGVGMTLCYNKNQLPEAVNKALKASKSKRFIVEKYMDCDDMGIYYTFKDGYCSASAIYDRYTTSEQPGLSKVCLGGIYPSKHINEYYTFMHNNAIRMFKDLGITDGILMLSAFYENGVFYVYDTGFRLQGEAPDILIKEINKFDQIEMLIEFALTGNQGNIELSDEDDAYFGGKYAATLWLLLKAGEIAKIDGIDEMENDPDVIVSNQRLFVGDIVHPDWIGTEKQVLSRIYLVSKSIFDLANKLKYYQNNINVYDKNGNNMLLKGFDVDKALTQKKKRLADKVIVVTGGTSGVGRAAAVAFAQEGAKVVIGDNNPTAAKEVLKEMKNAGSQGLHFNVNLENINEINDLFKNAIENFSKVDGLFNYAGVTPISALDSCNLEIFNNVMNVNFRAAFFAAQNAINCMRKNQNGGTIVLTGSSHAWSGQKDRAAYACSKGALITLSEHIANNYADENIRCNYLTLGWTPTEGEIDFRKSIGIPESELRKTASSVLPMGRMLEYGDYIEALIYLFSDYSKMMTGSNFRITGGEYI